MVLLSFLGDKLWIDFLSDIGGVSIFPEYSVRKIEASPSFYAIYGLLLKSLDRRGYRKEINQQLRNLSKLYPIIEIDTQIK